MTDYEKGSPAWDIGMVLTRHVFESGCARRAELERTAGSGVNSTTRLDRALNTPCTCGAGDSSAESTSKEAQWRKTRSSQDLGAVAQVAADQ